MRQKKKIAIIRCAGKAACAYGCSGCGSCAQVCPKQAISVDGNGPAKVDRNACIGCGRCVKACQRNLILLVPAENTIQPLCSSLANAKETRSTCDTGCIGCGICEKLCPAGAIRVIDSCAVIDQGRCIACGMCAANCPRGVIHDANGILAAV